MAKIVKRKRRDGTPGDMWYSDFTSGGRRIREALSTDQKTAYKKLTDLIALYDAERLGDPVPSDKLSWDAFKIWYFDYLKKNRKPGTAHHHVYAIKYLEMYRKPKLLSDINPAYLSKFKDFMTDYSKTHGNKPGPGGLNRLLRANYTMMHTAYRQKISPVKYDYSFIDKVPGEVAYRIVWHPVLELQQIISIMRGDQLTVVLLASRAGLRKGEIAHLYKTDYNPIFNTITVRSHGDWSPKSKASERTVPLPPETAAAVWASICAAPASSPWLINIPGNRDSQYYLGCAYIKKVKDHFPQIKTFLHKLRHTYASHLVQGGYPLEKIQKLMGHSSLLITMRYAHLGQSDLVNCVDHLPALGGTDTARADNHALLTVNVTQRPQIPDIQAAPSLPPVFISPDKQTVPAGQIRLLPAPNTP